MTQTTTKKIKLIPDYGCHPLWRSAGSDKAGDINPQTLPLKPETIARLEKWAAVFDGLLNEDDPASSGFPSDKERSAFDGEGIQLWLELRKELSPEYEVLYFSQQLRQHLAEPKDLDKLLVAQ